MNRTSNVVWLLSLLTLMGGCGEGDTTTLTEDRADIISSGQAFVGEWIEVNDDAGTRCVLGPYRCLETADVAPEGDHYLWIDDEGTFVARLDEGGNLIVDYGLGQGTVVLDGDELVGRVAGSETRFRRRTAEDNIGLRIATDGYANVSTDGASLPALEEGAEDPAVGMRAPVLIGNDADGSEVTIGGSGEPRIVMFLAHWCPHCQREVPRVTSYLASNDPPVGFVSVVTGTDRTAVNFPPSEWLVGGEGWQVPTIYDDQANTAGAAYGLATFPFWVVLDPDGVVQARFSGELSEEQLASVVEFASGLDG